MSSTGTESDEDTVTLWVGKGKILDRGGMSEPETYMKMKVFA